MSRKLVGYINTSSGPMSWWTIEEGDRAGAIDATLRARGIDPLTWPWDLSTLLGAAAFRAWWDARPIQGLVDWQVTLAEIEAMAASATPTTAKETGVDVTREQIEARRTELLNAGRDAGYKTLAREFDVNQDTIRRRLGRRRK